MRIGRSASMPAASSRVPSRDLPVVQASKIEFVINLNAARPSASKCRQVCPPAPTRSSNNLSRCLNLALFGPASRANQCPSSGGDLNRSTQHLLILLDKEAEMVTSRISFTAKQKDELWEHWKNGQSALAISRALERRNKTGVQRIVALNGGISPAPRCRAAAAWKLEDRQEISRGIAAGRSVRRIARGLKRSPSTISRETRRNGGSQTYRENRAERSAWGAGAAP